MGREKSRCSHAVHSVRAANAAFSLPEILVAAAVLALLLALVLAFIRHSSAASISLTTRNTFQSICGTVTDQLKQDFASAREVTLGRHRIEVVRYSDWSSGNGLSTEHIRYSANTTGLLVERGSSRVFHDFSGIQKAIQADLEFTVSRTDLPQAGNSGTAAIEVGIRLLPRSPSQTSPFAFRTSFTTSAHIKAAAPPEAE